MKTAEDYFKKYGNRYLMIGYSNLSKILTEHDNELISEIEKKIREHNEDKAFARVTALTEIINLIKGT